MNLPAPYYERDGITIYHGDCREILPHVEADAVVTDPPYGIADAPIPTQGRTRKRTGAVNDWHPPSEWGRELDPSWLPAALSIGPVALFGHWRKRRAFEDAAGMEPRAEIVWAKDTHVGPPCPVAARDERIWVFSRSGIEPRRFETSVWEEAIIPTWAHRAHKNEKPISLMRRLIAWMPGDTILDPFIGSGTTLVAAKLEGRRAIGIEIEERYCEIAAKRLAQGVFDFSGRETGGRTTATAPGSPAEGLRPGGEK